MISKSVARSSLVLKFRQQSLTPKMNGKTPQRASSVSSTNTTKSLTCRVSEKKRKLTATFIPRVPQTRRQRQQPVYTNVVHIEQKSVSEFDEGDDEEKKETPISTNSTEEIQIKPAEDKRQTIDQSFINFGVSFFVLALTIVCVLFTYTIIEQMNETYLVLASLLPLAWHCCERVLSLRIRQLVWRVAGLVFRGLLVYWIIGAIPYKTNLVIFQQHQGVFPVCAIFTLLTLALHFLIRRSSPLDENELGMPELGKIEWSEKEDPEEMKRMERRWTVGWIYTLQVLVAPILEEILYRGVVVASFAFFYRPHVAAAIGSVAYLSTQSYDRTCAYVSRFVCGIVWGMLFLMTNGNLMYPYVAHLMHNALIFGIYHSQTIVDCF